MSYMLIVIPQSQISNHMLPLSILVRKQYKSTPIPDKSGCQVINSMVLEDEIIVQHRWLPCYRSGQIIYGGLLMKPLEVLASLFSSLSGTD